MLAANQVIREDDIMAHVEDTDLFIVWRDMRPYKLTWNQMTTQERQWIIEEREYDYHCRIHGIGMYKNWYV